VQFDVPAKFSVSLGDKLKSLSDIYSEPPVTIISTVDQPQHANGDVSNPGIPPDS